jgi:hypothetical protein
MNWKRIVPHLTAIGVFLTITVFYCSPALQGKVLQQSDVIHWKGMSQGSVLFKEKFGHYPLWTNTLFGGMPSYQVAMEAPNPISLMYLHKIITLFLPSPFCFFFLMCIGFYFLSQVLRFDYRLGIMAALAYAFASYTPIIVAVGHETKALAMGYAPFLLGGIFLIFQKRYYVGAAFTSLFAGLMIAMNHPQISYYFLLCAAIMCLAYGIYWFRQKEWLHAIKSFSLLVVCAALGILANMVILATTYDYSKATARNGTLQLDSTGTQQQVSTGLDIDYAFSWSYGVIETISIMVPNIYAGASNGNELTEKSHLAKYVSSRGADTEQAKQFARGFPMYWGPQLGGTSGPVYLGAVITLLFILGLFNIKNVDKWWIAGTCLFLTALSWGKNFPSFNNWIFDHLPLYNKFRAPSMALVIPQLLFPLLGMMSLQQIFFVTTERKQNWLHLRNTGFVVIGLLLIAASFYSSFDYKSETDERLIAQLTQFYGADESNGVYNAIIADRQSLFGNDLLRSFLYLAISFGILTLWVRNKLKTQYALLALVFIAGLDVITQGRRYLNKDSFQTKDDQSVNYFSPSAADQQILSDTGYYRVLNLTQDVFNDALTSYFHRSVGGYHPAKLAIVEDVLNFQLRKQPMNESVLNMLNTKYLIVPDEKGQPTAQVNPGALGPCWFVKDVQFVDGAAAAMKAISNFNPALTAIVEKEYKSAVNSLPVYDSTATIQLIKNENETILYKSNSRAPQFAVFSEIFYDRGWKAFIDGKEVPIAKTNYELRGISIPAGSHEILFEFKPASYYDSVKIAIAASAIIWLMIVFVIFRYVKRKRHEGWN